LRAGVDRNLDLGGDDAGDYVGQRSSATVSI